MAEPAAGTSIPVPLSSQEETRISVTKGQAAGLIAFEVILTTLMVWGAFKLGQETMRGARFPTRGRR